MTTTEIVCAGWNMIHMHIAHGRARGAAPLCNDTQMSQSQYYEKREMLLKVDI